MPTKPATAATPPAKRTTPVRKGTAPRAAKKATRPKTGTGSKNGINDAVTKHGKFAPAVWARAEARAAREGRGVWEVLRHKLAEYADERD